MWSTFIANIQIIRFKWCSQCTYSNANYDVLYWKIKNIFQPSFKKIDNSQLLRPNYSFIRKTKLHPFQNTSPVIGIKIKFDLIDTYIYAIPTTSKIYHSYSQYLWSCACAYFETGKSTSWWDVYIHCTSIATIFTPMAQPNLAIGMFGKYWRRYVCGRKIKLVRKSMQLQFLQDDLGTNFERWVITVSWSIHNVSKRKNYPSCQVIIKKYVFYFIEFIVKN